MLGMNQMMAMEYSYNNYYAQPNILYQRQVSQRKRRIVSGEEANEYRIIHDKVYLPLSRSKMTGEPL